MDTRITIIVDNKASEGLISEHGLSFWVESGGKRILFDTGQGAALKGNTASLGIDLSSADTLVVSHGHYDHTGGMPYVIEQAPEIRLYCHPGVVQPRYVIRDNNPKSIGMPRKAREALHNLLPERIAWVQEPLMLTDTIGLTGPIPRLTTYEDTGGAFYLDSQGAHLDAIEDDLALWIETCEGTVVCLGCAHSGVINTLEYVQRMTHGAALRAVIGGFHLMNAEPSRIRHTMTALRAFGIKTLVPCHCTGDSATTLLKEAFGHAVSPGGVAATFSF